MFETEGPLEREQRGIGEIDDERSRARRGGDGAAGGSSFACGRSELWVWGGLGSGETSRKSFFVEPCEFAVGGDGR